MSSALSPGLTDMQTHILPTAEVDLAYDVHGPLPTADGRPPLMLIGQPMSADGFATLAALLPDRTVITYDPRGMGRSTRKDGRWSKFPRSRRRMCTRSSRRSAPVRLTCSRSSGGAVTALALVAAHPDDVVTLVAHEPPLIPVLPDAEASERARAAVRDVYLAKGWGAGMAAFIQMTSWQGEYTDDYFAQPVPDPAMFGMPTEDDGTRDDPLLSDHSWAVSSYRPDVEALDGGADEGGDRRRRGVDGHLHRPTSLAVAELLGQRRDGLPEPPRRVHGRRVRLRRAAGGFRPAAGGRS